MKINKDFNGTIIGLIFTIISLLLTFTYIIPIITIIPATLIENIMTHFISNEPYSNIGKATIITLFLIFLISLIIIRFKVKRKIDLPNLYVVAIMIIEFFIVHSLGFYLYWANTLNYSSDGQLLLAAVDSFPKSSLSFVFIGVFIDIVKKH